MQRNPEEQHFTGTVRMEGPVHVDDAFHCDSINGLNITHLSEILVNKSTNNTVIGRHDFLKLRTVNLT